MKLDNNYCTCCTCGYKWPKGTNGSHNCSTYLLDQVNSLQQQLDKSRELNRQILKSFRFEIDILNSELLSARTALLALRDCNKDWSFHISNEHMPIVAGAIQSAEDKF